MGPLKLGVIAALLASVAPLPAAARPDWSDYVAEASARFGVPEAWIRRVMAIESGGRTTLGGRPIRSPKGAMGIMQLMPATWRSMQATYRLGPDPDDPHDNILAGTAYLRLMYDRFGYPGLFAAYNAGPGRYASYLGGDASLPRETRGYVASATGNRTARVTSVTSPAERPGLFAITRPVVPSAPVKRAPDTAADRGGMIVIQHD